MAANLLGRGLGALDGGNVKQAAPQGVFGFEIMLAPFVVAHVQVGLTLQGLDAELADTGEERVGIFLTNALTAREPRTSKPVPFPELEKEHQRAQRVKQQAPVPMNLADLPYNSFAGMAVDGERALSDTYRSTQRVRRSPRGRG